MQFTPKSGAGTVYYGSKPVGGLYDGRKLDSWKFKDGSQDGGSKGPSGLGSLRGRLTVAPDKKTYVPKVQRLSVKPKRPVPGKAYTLRELENEDW